MAVLISFTFFHLGVNRSQKPLSWNNYWLVFKVNRLRYHYIFIESQKYPPRGIKGCHEFIELSSRINLWSSNWMKAFFRNKRGETVCSVAIILCKLSNIILFAYLTLLLAPFPRPRLHTHTCVPVIKCHQVRVSTHDLCSNSSSCQSLICFLHSVGN